MAGARLARASFTAACGKLYRDLVAAQRMTRRLTAMRHRLEAVKARTGTREWQVKRRERTRQLIELGGLVVKAGLVDLTDDDRAKLYGAFLWFADKRDRKSVVKGKRESVRVNLGGRSILKK